MLNPELQAMLMNAAELFVQLLVGLTVLFIY